MYRAFDLLHVALPVSNWSAARGCLLPVSISAQLAVLVNDAQADSAYSGGIKAKSHLWQYCGPGA
jgi:hypothetical protein